MASESRIVAEWVGGWVGDWAVGVEIGLRGEEYRREEKNG